MITQQIRSEIGAAMKARDTIRLETLRRAVTALTNELVAKGRKPTEELTDAEAVVVMKRLGKQRKDAIERCEIGVTVTVHFSIPAAFVPAPIPSLSF